MGYYLLYTGLLGGHLCNQQKQEERESQEEKVTLMAIFAGLPELEPPFLAGAGAGAVFWSGSYSYSTVNILFLRDPEYDYDYDFG